jgi:hypothetical protein
MILNMIDEKYSADTASHGLCNLRTMHVALKIVCTFIHAWYLVYVNDLACM